MFIAFLLLLLLVHETHLISAERPQYSVSLTSTFYIQIYLHRTILGIYFEKRKATNISSVYNSLLSLKSKEKAGPDFIPYKSIFIALRKCITRIKF